jgi:hypothetical protein
MNNGTAARVLVDVINLQKEGVVVPIGGTCVQPHTLSPSLPHLAATPRELSNRMAILAIVRLAKMSSLHTTPTQEVICTSQPT